MRDPRGCAHRPALIPLYVPSISANSDLMNSVLLHGFSTEFRLSGGESTVKVTWRGPGREGGL